MTRSPEIPKKATQFTVDFFRLTGYLISKSFWFLRYEGRENIPKNNSEPCLIAANHQTYIDPVWICLPLRRPIRYMAIGKAFGWPIVGKLIRFLGAFPVTSDRKGTVNAFRSAVESLRSGSLVMIFPEGVRSDAAGAMASFETGAVRIALEANVPILPVTISGGNRIWPRGQKYPHFFRRVTVKYHPIFDVVEDISKNKRENIDTLTTRLESVISNI